MNSPIVPAASMRFRGEPVVPVRLSESVWPFNLDNQSIVQARARTKAEVEAWRDWWTDLYEAWDLLGLEP